MFGDDLPKQVKDLTEVNRVGKKVTTNSGSSSRSHSDSRNSRNSRNYMSHSSSRGRAYRQARRPFFRLGLPRPTNKPPERKDDKARKVILDNKSLHPVSNVDVKVNKTLHVSNDGVAGRLEHVSSHWQNITSDHFILDSVTQYKIKFAAGFPQQEAVPRESGFSLQEQHIIQNEIDNLLNKGVIKETTRCEGEFISTIFIRPKKDGTYRLI